MNNGIKTGLLGWFDILGYKGFVSNSELSYSGEVIRDVFADAQARGLAHIEHILAYCPTGNAAVAREAHAAIKWIIFADTIVLISTVPQSESASKAGVRLGTFFELAKHLHAEFFLAGLPIRGAISFGEVYAHDTLPIFAGKEFVEIHELAEAQQWSGSVITSAAEAKLAKLPDVYGKILRAYTVQHDVCWRCKGRSEVTTESMLSLNWLAGFDWSRFKQNIGHFVEACFRAHNKDINCEDVQMKIKNTAAFISHMQERALAKP